MAELNELELETVKSLLADIKNGSSALKSSISSWRERLSTSAELTYPTGISLLSLKNHLLLSYLHHLTTLFSLRLTSQPLKDNSIVDSLVKLRVVLEKISPLEGKLKYQIEKLVRKADLAAEGGDDEDIVNDPLAFRPNPSALLIDRTGSEDEEEDGEDYSGNGESSKSGIYRPPRVAAMPYTEGPSKRKLKEKKPLPSHMLSDLSSTLSSSLPYGETTSGLSIATDATMQSGTARHLSQIERYELENFTRMRMSKKDSKKRRNEEEEVAFGGLGAGKGGKRRLGGFGAEFDDLLGGMDTGGDRRREDAYGVMKGFKKAKVGSGIREKDEGAGTSGLGPLGNGKKGKGKDKKVRQSTFDKQVDRAEKKRK